MDKHLFALAGDRTPKFNPLIVDGLAVQQMKNVEGYVDRIFQCAALGFPEGLEYLGFRRVTPQEEHNEVLRKLKAPRSTVEMSESHLYMVEYAFSYQGERLEPRYLYLPYVSDAGLITIRGSVFSISPVLADKTISVGADTIFIPMACGKLTFNRQIHNFKKNGESRSVYVVSSQIHNHKEKRVKGQPQTRFRVGADHTMMHYLLCKYGLTRTFATYGNAEVTVGYSDTINEINYPVDQWVICASTKMKPKALREKFYVSSDIRIAIPIEQYTQTTESMIGGFFYVVDFFPQRVEPEYVDEPRLWMTLLGFAIFGHGGSEGRLVEDIHDHLISLDKYLTGEIREALSDEDIFVENIYDFFVFIIENMNEKVTNSAASLSTMYGKKLMVLRYVLFEIQRAIFTLMFQLQSSAKKNLTKTEIINLMRRQLKTELIIDITKKHREVTSVSCPGDNKFYKITSVLVPQTSSSGDNNSKAKSNLVDPAKFLHSSIAEVANYAGMPKSDPIGKSRVSPYLRLTDDYEVLRNPDLVELLDEVQKRIQR
jgi:hypothetical protein